MNTGMQVLSIVVLGSRGMGKSLFSRSILINLKQLESLVNRELKKLMRKGDGDHYSERDKISIAHSFLDLQNRSNNTGLRFRFGIGASSPATSLDFLGIWRPIMRTMLGIYGSLKDKGKKPRKVLTELLENKDHKNLVRGKIEFIKNYFKIYDIDPKVVETDQVPSRPNDMFK